MALYSDILLTVDFDRTLTAPDSSIPQRNLDAIRHFTENGGAFTVNTGRSVPMFRQYFDAIPANAPFLLYNGSAAYDTQARELLLQVPIDLPLWPTMKACMDRFPDLNVELQGIDAHYCFQKSGCWEDFLEAQPCIWRHANESTDCGPFLKFSLYGEIRANTVAHLFQGTPEEFARIDEAEAWVREKFGDKMECFRAAPRILDVHAKGVSKIRAARALQEKLGRKILVCVGDAENDIPMLRGADFAYCPADGVVAKDFPNVCKCADGAVADVIYEKIPQILAKMA